MYISAVGPLTNHPERKTTLDSLEVWRRKVMGEGARKRIRTNNLLHIHCVQQEQPERAPSLPQGTGCSCPSEWLFCPIEAHCLMEPRPNNVPLWPCKDKVAKSQFSSYLSSFSVSRTGPLRMALFHCLGSTLPAV